MSTTAPRDMLAEYLRLDPGQRETRLQALVTQAQANGDSKPLAWWKNRMPTDRQSDAPPLGFPEPQASQGNNSGYMDLPRELVLALAGAGLLWGGQYQTGKDIMHFDFRGPDRSGTGRRRRRVWAE